MKLGIIGVGAVGAATAMAAVLRARVRELVLIDKDRARGRAVATDMHYGVPLSPLVTIKDGDYDDLEGAGLVIIAAGVNEKAGGATDRSDPAGRLRLLDANVRVFETIAPWLVKVAPDAVILIVTDPPEPLIDVTRRLVGHDRVIGTSTYLDSLRFRVHLAEYFAVSLCRSQRGWRARHFERIPLVFGADRRDGRRPTRWRSEGAALTPSAATWNRTCAMPISRSSKASAQANTASAWSPRASPRSCCEMNAR